MVQSHDGAIVVTRVEVEALMGVERQKSDDVVRGKC